MVLDYMKIPVKISGRDLCRRLGKRNVHALSARVATEMQHAEQEICELAHPRAIERIISHHIEENTVILEGDVPLESPMLAEVLSTCDRTVVFLLTLGEDVDQRIRETMERKPHYGFILDAAASVAAETTAQSIQNRIEQTLEPEETTTFRYSPGYCDWPIGEQEKLFALLPSDRIGVRLLDTALMSPRKTISGLMGIGGKEGIQLTRNACRTCKKNTCPYRREAA